MIEEVVNSILQAEDVAQNRVAQAKVKANEIVSAAEINAETFKKTQSSANKQHYAQQTKLIDQQSSQKAGQYLAEKNAQTDKEIAACEKNIDKAVKIILESI